MGDIRDHKRWWTESMAKLTARQIESRCPYGCRGEDVCNACKYAADGEARERARIVAMLREWAEQARLEARPLRGVGAVERLLGASDYLLEAADRIEGGEE
jgi:hypothetical protein